MTDEQDGGGFGIVTIVAIVLLFVALIGFAWMYFGEGGLINKIKEATKEFLPDTKELERIKEDVFNADELKIKKEEEAKEEIFTFFENVFNKVKIDECVHEIDFGVLKDRDFELEFSDTSTGTNIKIVRGERNNQIRVYNKEYKDLVCFYDLEYNDFVNYPNKEKNDFWLINKFENVFVDGKVKELKQNELTKSILYRIKGRVCFVGKDALSEINIYKKNSCELSEKISELEKISNYREFMADTVKLKADKTFINSKIELMNLYLKDKKFWRVLDLYIFLDETSLDKPQIEDIRAYRELAIDRIEGNMEEWVLCKSGNKHTCVANEDLCDSKEFEGAEFLPVRFESLQRCEYEREERVDLAEAASYILSR